MSVVSVKAIVDGSEINLSQNTETKMWEATAVAPAKSSYNLDGGYYGVTLIATDEAGNEATVDATDTELGEALRLIVMEETAPEIVITAPTEGEMTSDTTPTMSATITDDDSGVDPDTIKLYLNGDEITGYEITETDGVYTITYTPTEALEDGQYTVTVDASDHDGNAAETASITFEVFATAPELSVETPTDGIFTNNLDVEVSGSTNGVSLTIQIDDGDPVDIEIDDGDFSQTFTLEEGTHTITVVATSKSGVTNTVTRTIMIDTHAPVFVSVTLTPNPANAGKTYMISAEVVDE